MYAKKYYSLKLSLLGFYLQVMVHYIREILTYSSQTEIFLK